MSALLAAVVWIVGALAEPVDLRALEQLERQSESPEYREMAHHKRLEAMGRLRELLDRGAEGEVRGEMQLRLADLHLQHALYQSPPSPADLEIAADLYQAILSKYPSHPRVDQALWALGRCELELGRLDRAQEAYVALVKDHPDSSFYPDGHLWLAELATDPTVKLGLYGKVAQYPKHRRARYAAYGQAVALLELGEIEAAKAHLVEVATQDDPVGQAASGLHAARFGMPLLTPAPAPPPPAPPPPCPKMTAERPMEQLAIIRCWLDEGNLPQAANAQGILINRFGPQSDWPKNPGMRRHARRVVRQGQALVEGR